MKTNDIKNLETSLEVSFNNCLELTQTLNRLYNLKYHPSIVVKYTKIDTGDTGIYHLIPLYFDNNKRGERNGLFSVLLKDGEEHNRKVDGAYSKQWFRVENLELLNIAILPIA